MPAPSQLDFFGDADGPALTPQRSTRLEALGGEAVEIDFAPFREAGELLYGGPWIAERHGGDRRRDRASAEMRCIR